MSDSLTIIDRITAAVACDSEMLTIASAGRDAPPLLQDAQLDGSSAVPMIAAYLYAHYYAFDPDLCNPDALDYLSLLGHRLSDVGFIESLAKANPGHGYFSNGWQVTALNGEGGLTVHKQGITLQAKAKRHLRREEWGAEVGQSVAIRFPKDSAGASPGFYVAHSDAGPPEVDEVSRVYFNLRPEGAVRFTGLLLECLLRTGLPYSYKVLADPSRFRRRDSAVLYLRRTDFDAIIPHVLATHAALPHAFEPTVPSFTLRVRDGVGVADNPKSISDRAVSFGQHRTRLMAEAIKRVVSEGALVTAHAIRSAILRSCAEQSLDPTRLHLSARDAKDYPELSEVMSLVDRGSRS